MYFMSKCIRINKIPDYCEGYFLTLFIGTINVHNDLFEDIKVRVFVVLCQWFHILYDWAKSGTAFCEFLLLSTNWLCFCILRSVWKDQWNEKSLTLKICGRYKQELHERMKVLECLGIGVVLVGYLGSRERHSYTATYINKEVTI
jgi:hypothetical protein